MHGKTKRGNIFIYRSDKKTTGYSKVKADCKKKYYLNTSQQPIEKLCVLGTFDHLAKMINPYFKKIKKEHPTDKGYFKECYVLTERGKHRLKTCKFLKRDNIPLWEYMFNTNTI